MMRLLPWCYASLLLLVGLWAPTQHANAILSAECTASMTPSIINISNAITPSNADSANINATLNYTCKNTDLLLNMKVSVCLSADGGNVSPSTISPRFLKNTANNSRLAFNLALSNDMVWGSASGAGSIYKSVVHTLAPRASISVDVPIKVALIPNHDNPLATLGTYTNTFNTSGTAITYSDTLQILSTPNCSTDIIKETKPLLFTVQATVVPKCLINTTSDVNLGVHTANKTNISDSNNNAITTTCTNAAPYYIGLSPSNGNLNGAGVMSAIGNNTDKVPYQLRQTAGSGGIIWGNTATSTDAGNGVAGIGTGMNQSHTVYATVPNANVIPDDYSDTVTIRVHY